MCHWDTACEYNILVKHSLRKLLLLLGQKYQMNETFTIMFCIHFWYAKILTVVQTLQSDDVLVQIIFLDQVPYSQFFFLSYLG